MFYKQHILENVRNRGTETKKIVKISAIFLFLSQKQSYFRMAKKIPTMAGSVTLSI